MNYAPAQSSTGLNRFTPPVTAFNELSQPMFNSWIEFLDVKETTLKSYTKKIQAFSTWLQENRIAKPVRADIIRYRDELSVNHKPGTVNAYLVAVKQFFVWASSEGLYPNVSANVKPLKDSKGFKRQHLTTSQSKELLVSIDIESPAGKRDYAMILLMLTTGLRTIEVQRACIEDIQPVGDYMVLWVHGKGRDSKDKYVKLAPVTESAIRSYLATKPHQKFEGAIFTSISNRNCSQGLSRDSIGRIVKKHLRGIDLDRAELTAHSLRHTTATLNIVHGGTLKETQELLRHENPQTSERYIHALDRENNSSEYRIESALFS